MELGLVLGLQRSVASTEPCHVLEALQVAALEQKAGSTSFSFQILVTLANDTLLQHRGCAWWPVHRKTGTGHALGDMYMEKLAS